MTFSPAGLATGIGSLPYKEPLTAVRLIQKYFAQIPHWPQLPKRTHLEDYLTQFLNKTCELGLIKAQEKGNSYFTCADDEWPQRMEAFYNIYLEAIEGGNKSVLHDFGFPPGAADGFSCFVENLKEEGIKEAVALKGQVVGLLSVGFQITDDQEKPSFYDPQLRDILLKQLCLQAAWQVMVLKEFGLPVIIFMDDPVIYRCGSYDSIGVSRENVIDALQEFTATLHEQGAIVGVHTCADVDWSILFDSGLDIISFDSYQFIESFMLYSKAIKHFMEKGGVVAWGIAPTSINIHEENLETMKQFTIKHLSHLCKKGIAPELLYSQSLITPACGTGTLTDEMAVKIYDITAGLSADWKDICEKI